MSLSLPLSFFSFSLSLSPCWSYHVSSSLWSIVRKVTRVYDSSLKTLKSKVSLTVTDKVTYPCLLKITLYFKSNPLLANRHFTVLIHDLLLCSQSRQDWLSPDLLSLVCIRGSPSSFCKSWKTSSTQEQRWIETGSTEGNAMSMKKIKTRPD